jgi:hypothetical protein
MPAWMRPTILQREAEHLNAIDQVVWYETRDKPPLPEELLT